MSNLILTFNQIALDLIGTNTRLRVASRRRGGMDNLGFKSCYRVPHFHSMIRTEKREDGSVQSVIPSDMLEALKLQPVATGTYEFKSIGYGWFLLKQIQDGADTSEMSQVQVINDSDTTTEIIQITDLQKQAEKSQQSSEA